VKCVRCAAENPDTNKYCGECGALNTTKDGHIRDLATSVFNEQFKKRDQKLLEVETVDAVYRGLTRAAVPIVALLALAGWVGWGKYDNALGAIESAKVTAIKSLQDQTGTEADSIRGDAAKERTLLQESARQEAKNLQDEQSNFKKQYVQKSATAEAELEQYRAKLKTKEAELAQVYRQGTALRAQYDDTVSGLTSMGMGGASLPGINLSATQPAILGDSALQPQPVYSLNSSGPEVEKIQERLKQLNCYSGEISGHYDEDTKQAVERFNRYRGEAFPSGVVDVSDWITLFSPIISEARTPVASSSASVFVMPTAGSYLPPVPGAVSCPKED
jgi:hypothetical protein